MTGGGGGINPYWTPFLGDSIDFAFDDINKIDDNKGMMLLADGSISLMTSLQVQEQISLILASGTTNVTISKPQGVQ